MNRSLALTAVALATMLTACGQAQQGEAARGGSIGVSSTSSSSSETGVSTELSRLRKQVVAKDAKATVSMSASAVVDTAFAAGIDSNVVLKVQLGLGSPAIANSASARSTAEQLPEADPLRAYLMDAAQRAEAAEAERPVAREARNAFDAAVKAEEAAMASTGPAKAAAEAAAKAAADVYAEALQKSLEPDPHVVSVLAQADAVMRARALYSIAVRGMTGWEIRPPLPAKYVGGGGGDVGTYQAYTRSHELGVCVASLLGGALAKQLTGDVLQDPEAARRQARAMALVILKDSAVDVLSSCERQFPLQSPRIWDGTGTTGAVWTVTQADGFRTTMTCTTAGCEAVSNGVTTLGRGQYAGVGYELAFARAVGSSTERSTGTGTSAGTRQSTTSDTSVGLGK